MNLEKAKIILELVEIAYSEGLLSDEAVSLTLEIYETYPEICKRYMYMINTFKE